MWAMCIGLKYFANFNGWCVINILDFIEIYDNILSRTPKAKAIIFLDFIENIEGCDNILKNNRKINLKNKFEDIFLVFIENIEGCDNILKIYF